MFTPSREYWKDLQSCDARLHKTAQARAGGWWRHDAQDLWRPANAPDVADATIAAETAESAPNTSWNGWHIWGASSITGHLMVGEVVEPNLALNPHAKPSILRTTYTYSFNKLPFAGGNHVQLTRHTDQTPDDPPREQDMDEVLQDTIEEKKIGMTALRVPEEEDYEALLQQMKIGASGQFRVPFE